MVLSDLQVTRSDLGCPKAIRDALAYLRTTNFSELPDGDYPIIGRRMYAKIFHLTTKPEQEVKLELHREYVDVQYWISGREKFGFASDLGQGRVVEERAEEDIRFYDDLLPECYLRAEEGDYAVFYPWDFHGPGMWAEGKPEECRKVVVKVSMELLEEENLNIKEGIY